MGVDPSTDSPGVVAVVAVSDGVVDSAAGSVFDDFRSTSETPEVDVQAVSTRPRARTIACHRFVRTLITPEG